MLGGRRWGLCRKWSMVVYLHINPFNFLTYCQRLMTKFYYIRHIWEDEAYLLSHRWKVYIKSYFWAFIN